MPKLRVHGFAIPSTVTALAPTSRCALAAWSKYLAEMNKHEAATQHLRGDQVQSCAPGLSARPAGVDQGKK